MLLCEESSFPFVILPLLLKRLMSESSIPMVASFHGTEWQELVDWALGMLDI